jgi:hypothetical protein
MTHYQRNPLSAFVHLNKDQGTRRSYQDIWCRQVHRLLYAGPSKSVLGDRIPGLVLSGALGLMGPN